MSCGSRRLMVIFLTYIGWNWLAEAQCNGSAMEINNGTGTIQSPNYPSNEHGKAANCSWKFMFSGEGKYPKLTLKIAYQKLWLSRERCSGNYLLVINNVTQHCKHHSPRMGIPTYTYSYTNICENVDQQHLQHVLVQYSSEGKRSGSTTPLNMGFKIEYKNGECVDNDLCNGGIKVINSSKGTIQLPNNGFEYGKRANCSWKLLHHRNKNYTLTLTIIYQRLYFVTDDRNRTCSGSYSLTIDGATQPCGRYIDSTYGNVTTFIFSDSLYSKDVPTPSLADGVIIEYISDGRTFANATELSSGMGFQIEYEYKECLDGETTTQTDDNATYDAGLETTPSEEFTDSAESDMSKMSETTLLLLVSIPGLIGILILVVAAVLFCRKSSNDSFNIKGEKIEEVADKDKIVMKGTSRLSEDESRQNLARADQPGSSESPTSGSKVEDSVMYAAVVRNKEDGDKVTIHL